MDRDATAAFLSALAANPSQPCFLFDIMLDTPVYSTSAWANITWNSQEYQANGHFLQFDNITESTKLQSDTATIMFSSVDQSWVSVALSEATVGKTIIVRKAMIDYNSRVVTSPVIVFEGTIDQSQIQDVASGQCSITLSAFNHIGDFNRSRGRHTNDKEQKLHFPGDEFFNSTSQLNKEIKWGAA